MTTPTPNQLVAWVIQGICIIFGVCIGLFLLINASPVAQKLVN